MAEPGRTFAIKAMIEASIAEAFNNLVTVLAADGDDRAARILRDEAATWDAKAERSSITAQEAGERRTQRAIDGQQRRARPAPPDGGLG